VAVTRAGAPRLDVGALVGQEGDVLHLAVLRDTVAELEQRLGADAEPSAAAGGEGS
jgi:hypothetical protein